jgi:hypothetical protein
MSVFKLHSKLKNAQERQGATNYQYGYFPKELRVQFCQILDELLARIFHRGINQRSGESVHRLDITQPNENATHRFFCDRL